MIRMTGALIHHTVDGGWIGNIIGVVEAENGTVDSQSKCML